MRKNLWLAVTLGVALLASGCGSSATSTTATTASSPNVTTAAAAATSKAAASTAAVSAASTAAASTTAAGSASTDGKKMTIGLEYSASSCEFCQNFANAVKAYGEEKGFEVLLTQGNRSVSNQITNAEGMLTKGAKIIGGFWDDPDACMTVKDECEAKDVWCIGVLTSLSNRANGYEKYRHVGSKNYDGGKLYGKYAAEHLPKNAKICELHGVSSDSQDQDRFKGFWDAMKEAGRTDVTVNDIQYTNTNREEGLKVVENWIQAYPDMSGFVSYSDELAVSGIEALRSAGLNGKVQVYSFDGSKEGIKLVQDGDMMCDVLQDYKAQAKAYVDLCVNIRDKGTSDDMDVPFALITPDNVKDYLNY